MILISPAEIAEMAEIIYNWSDYEYNPHGLGRSPISAISAISAGPLKYKYSLEPQPYRLKKIL
jgi:hypothetical protein